MDPEAIVAAAKYLAAGICMGLGAIGPALGEGIIGAHALDAMARQPEMANTLLRTMVIADAIAETTGIYSFVVALVLIFVV